MQRNNRVQPEKINRCVARAPARRVERRASPCDRWTRATHIRLARAGSRPLQQRPKGGCPSQAPRLACVHPSRKSGGRPLE